MNKMAYKLVISWCLLLLSVLAVLFVRNRIGVIPIENSQPVITSIQVNDDLNIGIQWECSNTTVTSYNIYKETEKGIVYLSYVPARITHYWDTNPEEGVNIYRIKALCSQSNTDGFAGNLSSPSAPIIIDSSKKFNQSLDQILPELTYDRKQNILKWEKIVNVPVSGYIVMKRENKDNWVQIGKTENSEFYLDQKNQDIKCEYVIQAYSEINHCFIKSKLSNIV